MPTALTPLGLKGVWWAWPISDFAAFLMAAYLLIRQIRIFNHMHLNQQLHTTFTDYINRQRIEYAEQLLKADPSLKNDYLAEVSGFASEQSFLRNYRKFTGHNPRN